MPDKKLLVLLALLIILILGHDLDHLMRGDLRLSAPTAPIFIPVLAKYAILGFGFYFTLKNKLGPLFWAVLAGLGVTLGWLAHFSPFSEQTPQYIYHAYQAAAAGTLAVVWLAALMLVLIATLLYAEYLWARRPR
ncbi:MAG TPA: hypothetical protein VME69_16755 [Methylocella sp.]|nr:hypothetical protein [Methylocella sp.]